MTNQLSKEQIKLNQIKENIINIALNGLININPNISIEELIEHQRKFIDMHPKDILELFESLELNINDYSTIFSTDNN